MIPERIGHERQTNTVATIAIIAAIAGWILTFALHPVWGLLLNVAAIILGLAGMAIAVSPRHTGGIISIIAAILGAIGVVLSIIFLAGVIVF